MPCCLAKICQTFAGVIRIASIRVQYIGLPLRLAHKIKAGPIYRTGSKQSGSHRHCHWFVENPQVKNRKRPLENSRSTLSPIIHGFSGKWVP